MLPFLGALATFACDSPGRSGPSGVPADPLAARAEGLRGPDCGAADAAYFAGSAPSDRDLWYGQHLRAMREPRLCEPSDVERYRFLWLRTFHRPVAVRVERTEAGASLTARELGGAGGYAPGELARGATRDLTSSEWAELQRKLDAAGYWTLPTDSDRMGLDGSQWVLEGARGDRYHVVDRWTPEEAGRDAAFRELCLFLLDLAGFAPANRSEIY